MQIQLDTNATFPNIRELFSKKIKKHLSLNKDGTLIVFHCLTFAGLCLVLLCSC